MKCTAADQPIYFTFHFFYSLFKLSKAISGSAGPIFMIFLSPNGSYLRECYQSRPVFFDFSRDVAMATNFGQKLAK